MKKLQFLLLLIIFLNINAFTQEPWSTIRPPFDKYKKLPNSTIVWENPNKQISYYYAPFGVTAVGPNFRVLPNTNEQDEIILTSNPLYPLFMFGSANTTVNGSIFGQGCYVTTDGGLNWYGTDLMPGMPSGASYTSDPAPAIDKNAVIVFSTLRVTSNVGYMITSYSTNYGVNWANYTDISPVVAADKNMTATDDVPTSPYYGKSYTVWTKWSSPYPIMISNTSNSGINWSTAQQINNPSNTSQGCDVVVGPYPAGVVYVCWSRQASVSTAVGFAKSTNGGNNWTVNESAFSVGGMRSNSFNGWGVRVNDFPRIAVDKSGGPRNGWIYIVDCEKNMSPAGTDEDVILHRSTDGGTTWSVGIRVNQDAPNTGKVQFFPCACVDAMGGINVLYYDNRNYPSYGDSCETYMSRSMDGGNTWTDIKVSDHRWKPVGEGGSGTYMGDYIGITAANGKVWPFWFDNKTGHMQAWTCAVEFGPSITHTPLGNTEQISGNRIVNCTITPAGSGINPSTVKLYYAKNSTTFSNVTMTNSGGTNWTANLPLSGVGTYNYYLTATDSMSRTATSPSGAPANYYSFLATNDTVKPIITHTPLSNTPKAQWPATVTATVTDNIGIDSVWVRWYKNVPANYKQFKLNFASGNTYSSPFNSVNADVNVNDSIFYRIIAQDNSTGHNRDSSALLKFKIINLVNACIGNGTTTSNYPFTTYWMDGRTQMLFTAAELTAAGAGPNSAITKIGFNVSSVGGPAMNGFNVRYQHTSLTSLSSWIETGWTTGFTGTYTVPATGWQYIDMTSPYFIYNGTSNLLVEVCYDNSSYTSYSPVYATSISGMCRGYYTDNTSGCTMTSGSNLAYRPNTCFTMTVVNSTNNISNIIPNEYTLNQNYPNPFNPVTRINFEIPKQGMVSLKVYDVLGREVKALVNEVKAPGVYSVDFNGTELSSGVYFYKLESNGFSDIKKMMLIK